MSARIRKMAAVEGLDLLLKLRMLEDDNHPTTKSLKEFYQSRTYRTHRELEEFIEGELRKLRDALVGAIPP